MKHANIANGLVIVAVCVVVSLVVLPGAVAGSSAKVCFGTFSGTAIDLVVPAGGSCALEGAKITHDVIVQTDAVFSAEGTTIGHDLNATKPQSIALGFGGPVKIGHDALMTGADPNGKYVDVCDTTIKHDLRITGLTNSEEIEVGDLGEFCDGADSQPNTIGHDAVVNGNAFGTYIDVGDNSVGRDLSVSGDKGTAGSYIDVSDNTVGRDATCFWTVPGLSKDDGDDGPNSVGRNNKGCG
jgi:hypothetical protein